MTDYYKDDVYDESLLIQQRRKKQDLKQSLDALYHFRQSARWTAGIQYELDSITKYYKSQLYDLRHISDS